MKPFGTAVHWRRGTVETRIVLWLVLGSVPAAFAGIFIVRLAGPAALIQQRVQFLLGVALFLAAAGMFAKILVKRSPGPDDRPVEVRKLTTLLIGAVGGLVVGMTSVGSGSLVIVAVMAVYPTLSSRRLVGTDLAQAVPMVAAAALGHVLFGEFRLPLTMSILIGAIPGVYLGSRLSAASPNRLVRPALALVLFVSAIKLVGVTL